MENNIELREKVAHLEEREKSNTKRLDVHEREIAELKETNAILKNMNYRMEQVESAVSKIDKKLDDKIAGDIGSKGKKWDKLIDYLFYAILGVLLSYIAYKLGLK